MTETQVVTIPKLNGTILEPFISAMTGASGINEEQVKICVLYALCTYREDLSKIPILAVIGGTATGKSSVLDQLQTMVREPKLSKGTTIPTMRDEMDDCRTYIVHEADKISERLIQCRSEKELSSLTYKVDSGHGWTNNTVNIFGATILARRTPFRDSAVRNRSIVIHTAPKKTHPDYSLSDVGSLSEVVRQLNIEKISLGSGRVKDTWTPLIEVAKSFDDASLEASIIHAIEAEQTIFKSGQQYEADDVVLQALDSLTWNKAEGVRIGEDLELPKVTEGANNIGDVKLSNKLVEEILLNKGFKVTYTHGTKCVRSNPVHLEELLQGW
jgi:hypothetical protein